MKRLIILIALALTLIALMATAVFGYSIKIHQNSYSSGIGGEFTVESLDNELALHAGAYTGYNTKGVRTGNFNFETFCLEYNEHFSPGGTYYAEINPLHRAISGDSSAGYDVISKGTAWLYLQFISGSLTGYQYYDTANRKTQAGKLQQAIWFLEDEGQGSINNDYVQLAISNFGGIETAHDDYVGVDVSVLNVWADSSKTVFRQDQLIDPAPVPEPATLLLLGLGIFGLGVASRKKFKK